MASSEYRPGKREDFDRLYRQTYDRIFRTLISVTGDRAAAEDCTQDAFLQAFKAWSRWKQDAPAEAWVHRIAINTAISYQRKQKLREVGELIRRLGKPVEPDPEDQALSSDLLRAVWGATVTKTVASCKDGLKDGQHGIGHCVSAVAKTHGPAMRAEHSQASAARTDKPHGKPSDVPHGKSSGKPGGGKPSDVKPGPRSGS